MAFTEWHWATYVQLLEDKSWQSGGEVKSHRLTATQRNGLNWYNTKIKPRSHPHPTTHKARLVEGWEEMFSVPGKAVPVSFGERTSDFQHSQITLSSSLGAEQISTSWLTLLCHPRTRAATHGGKAAFNSKLRLRRVGRLKRNETSRSGAKTHITGTGCESNEDWFALDSPQSLRTPVGRARRRLKGRWSPFPLPQRCWGAERRTAAVWVLIAPPAAGGASQTLLTHEGFLLARNQRQQRCFPCHFWPLYTSGGSKDGG